MAIQYYVCIYIKILYNICRYFYSGDIVIGTSAKEEVYIVNTWPPILYISYMWDTTHIFYMVNLTDLYHIDHTLQVQTILTIFIIALLLN